MTNKLLTVPEVAEALGKSPRTIYDWSRTGRTRLVFTRIESAVRVREDDLAAYIDAGRDTDQGDK